MESQDGKSFYRGCNPPLILDMVLSHLGININIVRQQAAYKMARSCSAVALSL